MATEKISEGEVVWLKSGGPAMTVETIEGTRVYCSWFDGKKRMSDVFSLQLLTNSNPFDIGL